MTVFVEGGGDTRAQQAGARKAFRTLFEKAGLAGRLPRVEACGGRSETIRDFRTALRRNEDAVLLVDSEGPVGAGVSPEEYLVQRGEWARDASTPGERIHLMVQVMEAWLVSQPEVLRDHFGSCFNASKLAKTLHPESVAKVAVAKALDDATRDCPGGAYSKKKRRGFEILERLEVAELEKRLPHARRFFEYLRRPATDKS